ncbi:DoxX family protein [Nocardioides panzhihuensis]|uniref:VIT1/CCC1 family predicted Fe2+/Mn2+ transporter n=1 Tax=Nocardioides panzhihuensis TaxID=860243 RepID=A0A7Z0IV30_9ACTN|nr:DoxX family protein [Nocardioides panzhihuensis]NYI80418.1 VIT1/CCC1 family predicted Fe2+/Mn2+ transporter [Nocardioides panzhihuensis]
MHIILWVAAIFLTFVYLGGGLSMLLLSKERFRNAFEGWHYAEDFPAGFLKLMGVMKVLAAAGLILPAVTGTATWLVPLAALGLVLLMTGAATTRIIRKEWGSAAGDLVFWSLAAFVAVGRFELVPF